MGYVACLGQIPEETAHVLQNLVSANGLRLLEMTTHVFAEKLITSHVACCNAGPIHSL